MKALCGFIPRNWSCALALTLAATSWAADSDVVLNEIMYHPPGDREDLQYVELFNRGDSPVDLGGWRFTKGLKFSFPEQTTPDAVAFLVVCRNLESFRDHYGKDVRAVGEFTGRLSRGGERLDSNTTAAQRQQTNHDTIALLMFLHPHSPGGSTNRCGKSRAPCIKRTAFNTSPLTR